MDYLTDMFGDISPFDTPMEVGPYWSSSMVGMSAIQQIPPSLFSVFERGGDPESVAVEEVESSVFEVERLPFKPYRTYT